MLLLVATLLASPSEAYDLKYDSITPHPRLMLTAGKESLIEKTLHECRPLSEIHNRIIGFCDAVLPQPPVTRIMEGKRLLSVSRTALKRIFYLSYAYRMTGRQIYAQRAQEEMLAACGFSDWNPSHFLDVAEMTFALAIGYDWLYDVIEERNRDEIRDAIINKGLEEALDSKKAWFYRKDNNWNQVCNSAMTLGALAVFEHRPQMCREIIEKCIETNPLALRTYAPDGGYPEGYMYWNYGTAYQAILLDALMSALGDDAGLGSLEGFRQTARFMQMMSSPTGKCFNFSDCYERTYCNPAMFYFAAATGDNSLLWVDLQLLNSGKAEFSEDRLLPISLIFASRLDMSELPPPEYRTWCGKGSNPVYIYRSGWLSESDTYLAVKGGSAGCSHGHMDAGSFVFETGGTRWASDLGMQSYITLESKGVDLWNMDQQSDRWNVFRLGAQAHNTLTANGQRHDVKAFAPIREINTRKYKGAEVDLTSTLGGAIEKAVRTIKVSRQGTLTVCDRIIAANSDTDIEWTMLTRTEAEQTDKGIVLTDPYGQRMLLEIRSPKGTAAEILPAGPVHDFDAPNPGVRRIVFHAKAGQRGDIDIIVRLKKEK